MQMETKKLDRATIRVLAEKNSAELLVVAKGGGNVYQKSLDQMDVVNEMAAAMTEDEAVLFLNMYSEELNACTQKTNDETNKILAEVATQNNTAEVVGGVIGALILFTIIFLILK